MSGPLRFIIMEVIAVVRLSLMHWQPKRFHGSWRMETMDISRVEALQAVGHDAESAKTLAAPPYFGRDKDDLSQVRSAIVGALLVDWDGSAKPPPSERLLYRLTVDVDEKAPFGRVLDRVDFERPVAFRWTNKPTIAPAAFKALVGAGQYERVAELFQLAESFQEAGPADLERIVLRPFREPLASMLVASSPRVLSLPRAPPRNKGGHKVKNCCEGDPGLDDAASGAEQPPEDSENTRKTTFRETLISTCSLAHGLEAMIEDGAPHEEMKSVISELNQCLAALAEKLHPISSMMIGRGKFGRTKYTPEHTTRSTFIASKVRGMQQHYRNVIKDILELIGLGEFVDATMKHTRTRDLVRVDMTAMVICRAKAISFRTGDWTTSGCIRYFNSDASPGTLEEMLIGRIYAIPRAAVLKVLSGEWEWKDAWLPARSLPIVTLGAGEMSSTRKMLRLMDQIWLELAVEAPESWRSHVMEGLEGRDRDVIVETLIARLEF